MDGAEIALSITTTTTQPSCIACMMVGWLQDDSSRADGVKSVSPYMAIHIWGLSTRDKKTKKKQQLRNIKNATGSLNKFEPRTIDQ